MMPVNFFNGSLIRYTLSERERSLGKLRWSFRAEETQQRSDQKQDRVKGASNKVRFNVVFNLFFRKPDLRSKQYVSFSSIKVASAVGE